MAYKDKDLQKKAQKAWIAKKRAKAKESTKKDIQDAPESTNSVEPDTNIPLVEPKSVSNPNEPIVSNPKPVEPDLSAIPIKRLYDLIDHYPHNTWVNSPEHKELIYRLHTLPVEQLQEEGYFIPVWKEGGKARRSIADLKVML